MSRLAPFALAVLLAIASAPTADAQLGGLLNRAKQAVTGSSDTPTEAPSDATAETSPTQAAASPAVIDGRPTPVMDYLSMMTTRYYMADGGYWTDGSHYILFYPERDAEAYWTVTDGEGQTLFTEESRYTRTGDAVFNRIRAPRFMGLGNSGFAPTDGEYALNMIVDGQLVGHIPYTVEVVQAGDAYEPRTEYRRVDGPWARLGYITHTLRQPEESLTVHGWVTASDMADGESQLRVTLLRDGEPVAACNVRDCPKPRVNRSDWTSYKTTLVRYSARDESNPTVEDRFAIADVQPGAYEVHVTGFESGTLIRRYALTGADGVFEDHPRSAMSYTPRYDHLSPRTVKPNAGGSGNVVANQTFWMDVVE